MLETESRTARRFTSVKEVEAPRFQDSQHKKVVGYQTYVPAVFTPLEIIQVLIYVRAVFTLRK